MTYAKIESNKIAKLGPRPNWLDDAGNSVSDATLKENGWLPVIYSQHEHDPQAQRIEELPQSEWAIESARVVVAYRVTEIPLEEARSAKNEEINATRLAVNFTSFTHAGKEIACDQLSRSDIDGTNGYVALNGVLPVGWPGGWKAVDNSYVAISTVDDWKAFYASMFAQGNANFAKAQQLKAQLEEATTTAQIAAIQWGD